MFRIAICEDESQFRRIMGNILIDYKVYSKK